MNNVAVVRRPVDLEHFSWMGAEVGVQNQKPFCDRADCSEEPHRAMGVQVVQQTEAENEVVALGGGKCAHVLTAELDIEAESRGSEFSLRDVHAVSIDADYTGALGREFECQAPLARAEVENP